MTSPLESLQQRFAQALSDPDCKPHVLSALAQGDETHVGARVDLYASSVRSHWRNALAQAYPVLLALVGADYFDALAIAYGRVHPSRGGDLNGFGAALGEFIGRYVKDPQFRYFADVARLEWALHLAYFARDAAILTPDEWQAMDGATLLGARLATHPACVAIASGCPAAEIWLAHRPGGVFPQKLDTRSWCVTVRPLWRPSVLVHSEAAHAAFVALQHGATLDTALDAAFALDPAFDFAAQWQRWIAAAAITRRID
ncbi:DNA-binding domain-containing protein [Paraburkholderia sp.]|uniref:HvfC/BufC N-terminal domain-containing protein n=1 Tax=Paraburkholderia sp. TaxID=1926495 RepID=UPI00239D5A05|nr:DNA-binding domain-containing protein [Paraburkholderia sp.]MDE1184797.1 DNA-binding domain-containing protein [Paraburkholderia sp.]